MELQNTNHAALYQWILLSLHGHMDLRNKNSSLGTTRNFF